MPLSEEGVAAANAALDRADQERKKGVPMHLRKNAAQVRGRCPTSTHPRYRVPALLISLMYSLLQVEQLKRLSTPDVYGPLEPLLTCSP